MSSSGYRGDYDHRHEIIEEDWDGLRNFLNSEGSSERFAASNFFPGDSTYKGFNAFHEVCYTDFPILPVDIVPRMLEIDEDNLFERVDEPSIRAAPLHLACESNASAQFVKTLLSLMPRATSFHISAKDARGMEPMDVAWLRHIDAAYRRYDGDENLQGQSTGMVIAKMAKLSCPDDSVHYKYAKDTWEKTVHMLFATTTEVIDAPTAWNIVQAIASAKVGCPNIAMWVALKLHPQQARWEDDNGNFPLHMAASCNNHYRYPVRPSGIDREDLVSITDAWHDEEEEGQTRLIIDEAQASPISMLVKIYPEAASIPNNDGRYPVHLAAERGAPWTDEVECLFSAAPGTINKRDPKTMLLPFMLAAVDVKGDSSSNLVYKLLRANPANVKGGIRSTGYEQYLENKVGEKDKMIAEKCDDIAEKDNAIAEKDSVIAELRSKLKRKAHAMGTEP